MEEQIIDRIVALPEASKEQKQVIMNIGNKNVVCESVAGSGKTTINLHIAQENEDKQILLLTYNAKLKIETRIKAKNLGFENIEVHTYHSFCVKYYDNKCITDSDLIKMLNNVKETKQDFGYDIIILDEAQDINPLYFKIICKMYKDNLIKNANLCILGDRYQSIYQFNDADDRFIKFAKDVFNLNEKEWELVKLSHSFRITKQMSDFVNRCMVNDDFILSTKIGNSKPRYIICDCFSYSNDITINSTLGEIMYYLELGYLPEDIFILAPSVKSQKTPVRQLANKISNMGIPIYVPESDEKVVGDKILEGKMMFSTFHQAKGLERKVVLVFNFDDSYFNFYKKDKDRQLCPNELYVATTRAQEHLTVFHHYENDYLPFIQQTNLYNYCDVILTKDISVRKGKQIDTLEVGVTKLIQHLPQQLLDECVKLLTIEQIAEEQRHINLENKSKQKNGYESVCDITGTAIPAYFEFKKKKKMSIYENLKREKNYINTNMTNDITQLKPSELLLIANTWNSHCSGYIYKLNQITNYDWLTEKKLKRCIDRIEKFGISDDSEFEQEIELFGEDELMNIKLLGYIDCVDKENIYELKCTEKLNDEHIIQVGIYAYLNETYKMNKESINNIKIGDNITYVYNKVKCNGKVKDIVDQYYIIEKENGNISKIYKKDSMKNKSKIKNNEKMDNYYLANIKTKEVKKITASKENLNKLVKNIIDHKYSLKKGDTNETFSENIKNIKNKYLYDKVEIIEEKKNELDKGIPIKLEKGISIKLEKGIPIKLEKGISIKLEKGISIKLEKGISIKLEKETLKILVIDTETTGLPDCKGLSRCTYPNPQEYSKYDNARMIEIGYIVYSIEKKEVNHLIKPEKFIIKNTFIHGITQKDAKEKGIYLDEALDIFYQDLMSVDVVIAHNMNFDKNIILAECFRKNRIDIVNEFNKKECKCTMESGMILNNNKWIKLEKLYEILYGNKINQLHRALSDASYCADCYFKLSEMKIM
jgi:DNA polymerase III epsilon subunit-like protein